MKSDVISELFSTYHNHALLYVYSLCKDMSLAEDISANAFFKAISIADTEIGNFKAWLLTVCRNEYYSHHRKSRKITFVELDESSSSPKSPDILDTIIKNEQYRALYRAISLIPEEQREVITLFYFSDFSIREISLTTGKSESNVKVLLHRARKSIKNILEV